MHSALSPAMRPSPCTLTHSSVQPTVLPDSQCSHPHLYRLIAACSHSAPSPARLPSPSGLTDTSMSSVTTLSMIVSYTLAFLSPSDPCPCLQLFLGGLLHLFLEHSLSSCTVAKGEFKTLWPRSGNKKPCLYVTTRVPWDFRPSEDTGELSKEQSDPPTEINTCMHPNHTPGMHTWTLAWHSVPYEHWCWGHVWGSSQKSYSGQETELTVPPRPNGGG